MTEENEPKQWSLDEVDDETLTQRLKKLPAFADLFAEPATPSPKPSGETTSKPSTGGGQEVPDNQAARTMSEIVRGLGEGLAKGLSSSPSAATPATPSAPAPSRTRKHWLWGDINE